MRKLWFLPASALALTLLGACATAPSDENAADMPTAGGPPPGETPRLTAKPLAPTAPAGGGLDLAPTAKPPLVVPGTGNFIDTKAAAKAQPPTQTQAGPGEVTLNFEGADIRDVVKVVFETLKENYTVDPQVQGEVTVQTSRPLAKEALLPTLETMLRMSNAVLVRDGGIYRIIPAAGAVQKGSLVPRLGGGKVGYGVRIVPLRYVSAAEWRQIDGVEVAAGAKAGKPRVFEMRTYTTPEGKIDPLHARFRDHTMKLFTKHGMSHLAYWTPVDADKGAGTKLIYILAHDSKEAGLASFEAFRADPDWIKAKTESEKDGSLTIEPRSEGVKSVYMTATDFSPIQ